MSAVCQILASYNIPASGGCTTVQMQNTSPAVDFVEVGDTANDYYGGQIQFDPGANVSICGIEFILTAVGNISGKTYTCEIYDDGNPFGTQRGVSAGISGSNAWSATTVKFLFTPNVSLLSGNPYDLLITANTIPDASNWVRIVASASGGIVGLSGNFTVLGVRSSFATNDCKITTYTP